MKNQLTISFACIVISLFSSCGPGSEQKTEHARLDSIRISDSIMPTDAEAMRVLDSINNTIQEKQGKDAHLDNNTIIPNNKKNNYGKGKGQGHPNAIIEKVPGTIAYYCPGRMLENTSNNVSLTISKATIDQAIEEIKLRVVDVVPEESVEMLEKDITGKSIIISQKMKVELKYSDKDFETLYMPENEEQIFDGNSDMYWDWIIKPIRIGTCQLAIVVSAFDEKNGRWIAAQTPPQVFNIKVQVNPMTYFEKLWDFLKNNPVWIFIQILFPIIAFFFGRKQAKK